jgi:hypothetical protein
MSGLVQGALAGAAGTTALNAVTYLDMVLRARPASDTPEQTVKKLSEAAKIDIPGSGEEEENRVQGLAPLMGIGVGVGVGAAAGVVHRILRRLHIRLPFALGALMIGAGAMAAANLPMKGLGISDPKTWTATDWLSDAVPHLAYGIVTQATLVRTDALKR